MSQQRLLLTLLGLGVLLLAVGAAVFLAFLPQGDVQDFGWFPNSDADWQAGWPDPPGDLRLTMVGAAVAGVGFLVVLVPIIAWAGHLGRRLDRRDD